MFIISSYYDILTWINTFDKSLSNISYLPPILPFGTFSDILLSIQIIVKHVLHLHVWSEQNTNFIQRWYNVLRDGLFC